MTTPAQASVRLDIHPFENSDQCAQPNAAYPCSPGSLVGFAMIHAWLVTPAELQHWRRGSFVFL